MKKFFSFLFTLLVIAAIGAMIYLHPAFFTRQLDKVRGMYYVHKGDKALKELKLQKAISYYNRAVQLYPEHYGAWYNLGNIYVVYEDYYSAVDSYEKAFEYNPKMMIARMNYGIVSAEKLGDFDLFSDCKERIAHLDRISKMLLCLGAANLCIGLGFFNLDSTLFVNFNIILAAVVMYGYARIQGKKEYLQDACQKNEKN